MVPSNPSMSSFNDIIHNDSVRYSRKGFGLIFAAIIILVYLIYFPIFVKDYLWDYALLLKNPNLILFITFYSTHEVTFIIGNLVMCVIYSRKIAFFEKYRISPLKPWPWEEDPKKWKTVITRTMKYVLFTHLLLIPAATGLEALLNETPLKFSKEDWPGTFELISQIIFFMICEDFAFYWGHRILHSKYLYPKIHKIHHFDT